MMMYFMLKCHRPTGQLAVVCLGLLGVSAYFRLLDYSFPLIGAYLIAYLGTSAPFNLGNAARFGDLSYGAYLYGWPIEQLVRFYLGDGAHWWAVFCISFPLALALGFVSWHLVEKPAMRLLGVTAKNRKWSLSGTEWSVGRYFQTQAKASSTNSEGLVEAHTAVITRAQLSIVSPASGYAKQHRADV
jgi:peptidoglycan/LPS O-acetylase OafA/YrhL